MIRIIHEVNVVFFVNSGQKLLRTYDLLFHSLNTKNKGSFHNKKLNLTSFRCLDRLTSPFFSDFFISFH